jgi:hypothetical protein
MVHDDVDAAIRLRAFRLLSSLVQSYGDVVPFASLSRAFMYLAFSFVCVGSELSIHLLDLRKQ